MVLQATRLEPENVARFSCFFNGIGFDVGSLSVFDKIFVLVSGGIDSTLLAEYINYYHPKKTKLVNCFNPYEKNMVLSYYETLDNFIRIKPDSMYDYRSILKESFLNLPKAWNLRVNRNYHKKIFPCCYYFKHKNFLNDPLFKEDGSVVISGIKRGDGTQRRIWLTQLSKGIQKRAKNPGKPSFFHEHVGGQVYCYPYRDYTKRELPYEIKSALKKIYPSLTHSGCNPCPVLVLFRIKNDERYKSSVLYAKKLGIDTCIFKKRVMKNTRKSIPIY